MGTDKIQLITAIITVGLLVCLTLFLLSVECGNKDCTWCNPQIIEKEGE